MIKVSYYRGMSDAGQTVFPLYSSLQGDRAFEKVASVVLPDVARFIDRLRPLPDAQYVLVNAMGSGEFYGSNANADWFDESGLIHCPDDWHGIPDIDKETVRRLSWSYGFPTFYDAHPFLHHRNKDPSRAYGQVELATWNPHMHRVELVIRVDKDKCEKFGGTSVWDKLKLGQFLDVSMGSKVPFDLCELCTDWKEYQDGLAQFDPKRHKSPGEAALAYHKRLLAERGRGIRGLAPTRHTYCEHMKQSPNKVMPDGRKVFVYNPFPKFFDISFVFVGADKTAKVMLKVAENRQVWSLPGASLAECMGYEEDDNSKTASDKRAQLKKSEIEKYGPAQFESKAIPVVTRKEPVFQKGMLDDLAKSPLPSVLGSALTLGIVFRPCEFQRLILVKMGLSPLADSLEESGSIFQRRHSQGSMGLGPMSSDVIRALESFFDSRSAFASPERRRVTVIIRKAPSSGAKLASQHVNLLNKIATAYSEYRNSVMDWMHSEKIASKAEPFTVAYFRHAYWEEAGQ